ncbi:MAG: RagB/SusD family nutrient uptake outer membrane protein [Bacilli bacterium]|nr:RagB/SusD family nutrient uptake outer membrane protein [Bacilli bacterium]
MKKYIFIATLLALFFNACDEDNFLKENPLDTMGAENSYITVTDFDAAINELYYLTRLEFFTRGDRCFDYIYVTDIVWDRSDNKDASLMSDYSVSGNIAKAHWEGLYKLCAQANTVINRLPTSDIPESSHNSYIAKARFFRGLAYRTLVYLYGGVPIVDTEVTSPKTDYVRDTRESVLEFAIEDVKFAAENLPEIDEVKNGEISNLAAYHLLSELYLANGQNQEAVDAATEVINSTKVDLMRNRFGTRTNYTDADVYWDLFQMNNQNRTSGNTEGIWVIQFEVDVTGGGVVTNKSFWEDPVDNYLLERKCSPQFQHFGIMHNGVELSPYIWPIGDWTGGRGIGAAIATKHFHNTIWGWKTENGGTENSSDWDNDIRNSNYNFIRKVPVNNLSFKQNYGSIYGDVMDVMNPPSTEIVTDGTTTNSNNYRAREIPNRYFAGYQSKVTSLFNHPEALYQDKDSYTLKSTAGGTFQDQYMFRLAETYLLRAEAYLKLNNTASAAVDINVVRARSNASPVAAADVNLDYILDERMREFGVEEKRRLTLARVGKLYERVIKYNPYYVESATNKTGDGIGMQEYYELLPIPLSVIEANKDALLEQNPGYN